MTPRRWLQFNLKSLLILVLIVALPCSWLAWKMDRKRRERAAVSEIRKLGGWVLYDWEDPNPFSDSRQEPPGPRWLRKLLGDDFFAHVEEVGFEEKPNGGSDLNDGDLVLLAALSGLKRLHLHSTVTDAAVVHLEKLQGLEELHVGPIGPPGMSRAGLTQLKQSLPDCDFYELELIQDDCVMSEQSAPSDEPSVTDEPPVICPPFLTPPARAAQ